MVQVWGRKKNEEKYWKCGGSRWCCSESRVSLVSGPREVTQAAAVGLLSVEARWSSGLGETIQTRAGHLHTHLDCCEEGLCVSVSVA